MNTNILTVSNISKTIKNKEIIKGINLELNKGEILGFLGPNGAGKSTTLRMIVGLSRPTSGYISICGYNITNEYVKAMSNVGCIIEEPNLYNYLSGYSNLEMLGSMSQGVTKKDIEEAVELVGMENRINDKVEIYSMGMKQRIGLAQALIHKPKLLVLDEPTNGLDPQGIHDFREIVKKLANDKGISVLISSHLISEVQLMCDKVSIINNGKIIQNGSVDEMISTGEVFWILNDSQKGQEILKRIFNIESVISREQLTAVIDLKELPKINKKFIQSDIDLKYVGTKKKTLEDLFLSLTEKQKIQ
ncbi:MAG: ABC transporter ATP-binding protein [Eubacteriales bacterium]